MLLAAAVQDWRDPGSYRPLLDAERTAFAWEWLRRQPAYREAALGSLDARRRAVLLEAEPRALDWGLHRFEDPDLAAPDARPIWSSSRLPFLLTVIAEPWSSDPDALILDRIRHLATLVRTGTGESLLLSDGLRSIRLDARGASLLAGPVRLNYELSGFTALDAALPVLRQLRALVRDGHFSRRLHAADRRASRQILLLRAHDALAAGASQRAIAAALLGGDVGDRWRVTAASLRSQAQRLAAGARRMAAGGFWDLARLG